MHFASSRRLRLRVALAALTLSFASAAAMADGGLPSSGLGQSWPNATDLSASPHWHVYVFQRDGVRYVQVNDLNGNVRSAVATVGGSFLALPVGVDASRVGTPQQPLPATGNTKGDVVYQDNTIKVLVAAQSDGSTQTYAASGDCHDPIECSSRINSPSGTGTQASATQAIAAQTGTTTGTSTSSGDCHDPIECSSRINGASGTGSQSGAVMSSATQATNTGTTTSSGDCHDPIECSSRINSTSGSGTQSSAVMSSATGTNTGTTTSSGDCHDPIECSSRVH